MRTIVDYLHPLGLTELAVRSHGPEGLAPLISCVREMVALNKLDALKSV